LYKKLENNKLKLKKVWKTSRKTRKIERIYKEKKREKKNIDFLKCEV